MLKQTEGSHAIAESVALCRPEVICAYPITPQTHIVEAVSYTHLDVYKRQVPAGGDLRLPDHAADPHRRGCLLYTSRCV